jgi:spore maturation protein CgeB
MMGACYLTEYCEDLDDLYEVGREIAVYRNAEELVGEARRLLEDGAARARMRRLGHAAALARHTWERRFEVLFRTLGLRSRASAG